MYPRLLQAVRRLLDVGLRTHPTASDGQLSNTTRGRLATSVVVRRESQKSVLGGGPGRGGEACPKSTTNRSTGWFCRKEAGTRDPQAGKPFLDEEKPSTENLCSRLGQACRMVSMPHRMVPSVVIPVTDGTGWCSRPAIRATAVSRGGPISAIVLSIQSCLPKHRFDK